MTELSSTKEPQCIENFLDEHGEELEQVVSDEELEEDSDVESTTMDKNTNLHFSAALGKIDTLKEDLESPDQKIDAENFMGWTPLMMAVRNGHIEVVKILLEKGADITKKNKLGVNTFNLSIANGNLDLMDMVIRHMLRGGISRNRIQENLSPISLAIIFKRTHLLRFLMSQGFDLNATTWKTGLTPLMFAAAVSIEKIIPVLEVKGANKNTKNYMGVNYQEIIQWRRHGLENMRVPIRHTKPKLTLPPIAVRTTKTAPEKVIPTTPTVEVVTIPIVEKMASPISPREEKIIENQIEEVNNIESLQPNEFVPQEVSVVPLPDYNIEDKVNDENDQNRVNEMDVRLPPPNVTSRPYFGGQIKPKRERRHIQPLQMKGESPIIQQSCQYQSPFNMGCPFYMPFLNSSYGSPVPSPITPVLIPPNFQNFMATVADIPQNSPMGLMSHNPYPCGSPIPPIFVHSPMARPDLNFTYDPNVVGHGPNIVGHGPNAFQGNPYFYPVYPPLQNVYPSPGPTS